MTDWEDRIETVAAELAEETPADWTPAVRDCWDFGLTEQSAREVCRSARGPGSVWLVLRILNAIGWKP